MVLNSLLCGELAYFTLVTSRRERHRVAQCMARPIVVGLAAQRIAGRVPVAEMKQFFAKKFAQLRQLGCAIPAGVEIAYHTTVLACGH